ncbi:cytoplasmic 60S subunit biogenesis factor ZNF622-like [Brevipalpus obovatus]|uniref:cytoplasmic 60S subunit biogenesis factor ZNF622-like n=1 Tax=Brevipalpus obovatus TaxID=246614 RepID=UPI003D9E6200
MSGFTCLTCKVSFTTNEWQKQHYRTDWHQYNLKRKVASLPAVPHEAFERLKQAKQQQSADDGASVAKIDSCQHCIDCRKTFSSLKAYEQHCQSRKHREIKSRVSARLEERSDDAGKQNSEGSIVTAPTNKLEPRVKSTSEVRESIGDSDDSDWESVDDDGESEAILPTRCFFCSADSQSYEENIEHMSSNHSFFIPDLEYLVDVEGLLTYLGEKIGIDHRCLWCSYSGRSFRSTRSAQQHMLSKGHSKINFEKADVLLEYAEFYDYSKSYPDTADKDKDDDEVSIPTLCEDENWQLVLPSGSIIGHRSLFRYYKQNLHPIVERTGTTASQRILDKVISNYKALGWTGLKGEAAVARAKDVRFYQKIRAKKHLDLGMKGNVTLQTHFRSQVFF